MILKSLSFQIHQKIDLCFMLYLLKIERKWSRVENFELKMPQSSKCKLETLGRPFKGTLTVG